MDTTAWSREICTRHETKERIDGRCRRCAKEELLSELEQLARGVDAIALDPAGQPLANVPRLDLWPRDFTWLTDETVAPERAAAFRRLFSMAYIHAARAAVAAGHPVQALLFLGGSMNFGCVEPALLGAIHFETSRALRAILATRQELDRQRMTPGGIRTLVSAACHLEVALGYLERAPSRACEGVLPAQLLDEGQALRREILAHGYFTIEGGFVMGPDASTSGPVGSLLFPSVPQGPDS